MRQTKPTLPKWRLGTLESLERNKQTKPILPEWHSEKSMTRSSSIERSHRHRDRSADWQGRTSTKQTQFGREPDRWLAASVGDRMAVLAFPLRKV
jgi:hypothetical protein